MRRKIAHYFYDGGVELQVFAENRRFFFRDKDGLIPFCPDTGDRDPHPNETDHFSGDASYEELGLFYGYGMSETGWSGDC